MCGIKLTAFSIDVRMKELNDEVDHRRTGTEVLSPMANMSAQTASTESFPMPSIG